MSCASLAAGERFRDCLVSAGRRFLCLLHSFYEWTASSERPQTRLKGRVLQGKTGRPMVDESCGYQKTFVF